MYIDVFLWCGQNGYPRDSVLTRRGLTRQYLRTYTPLLGRDINRLQLWNPLRSWGPVRFPLQTSWFLTTNFQFSISSNFVHGCIKILFRICVFGTFGNGDGAEMLTSGVARVFLRYHLRASPPEFTALLVSVIMQGLACTTSLYLTLCAIWQRKWNIKQNKWTIAPPRLLTSILKYWADVNSK